MYIERRWFVDKDERLGGLRRLHLCAALAKGQMGEGGAVAIVDDASPELHFEKRRESFRGPNLISPSNDLSWLDDFGEQFRPKDRTSLQPYDVAQWLDI